MDKFFNFNIYKIKNFFVLTILLTVLIVQWIQEWVHLIDYF